MHTRAKPYNFLLGKYLTLKLTFKLECRNKRRRYIIVFLFCKISVVLFMLHMCVTLVCIFNLVYFMFKVFFLLKKANFEIDGSFVKYISTDLLLGNLYQNQYFGKILKEITMGLQSVPIYSPKFCS